MAKNPVVIGNDQELAAALDRAEALSGCTNCSEEERELAAIADAIKVYTESMRVLRMVDANPNKTDPFASED